MIFHFRAVDRSDDYYYVTRWDKSFPVEICAETADAAWAALWKTLGTPPRYRQWTARLKGITAEATR